MKRMIKYTVAGALAALVLTFACSEELRNEAAVMWVAATGDIVDRFELELNQGTLALQRYDNAFIKEQQKLTRLKAVHRDNLLSADVKRERARSWRAQGKEDLALRDEAAAALYAEHATACEKSIEKRTAQLIELKALRERARLDVGNARELIAILAATQDALDQEGRQETLDRAEQNIRNLQSYCNRLQAGVEVLQEIED